MDIQQLVESQRLFYKTNYTKDINHRKNILRNIKQWINNNEYLIIQALKDDLNKDATESYMCEIGMVLSEINYQLKHINKWSKRKRVRTPIAQFYGVSYEYYEPYGVTLIMSPWNYPFLLAIEPCIAAIGAGNTVIIKPSEYAPQTASIIKHMIDEICPRDYVVVVEGDIEQSTLLLEQRFDYIFFTGSVQVGKIVMQKASHYLTPVTLELGGKSPCIIDDYSILKIAAKRIAFGKFLNAGQTCVAPDYILIKKDLQHSFVEYMKEYIEEFFGEDPLNHPHLVKIINKKHFHRLQSLLSHQDIIVGGKQDCESLKIEPTLIQNVSLDHSIMQEEIFGPILPIVTYQHIDDAISFVNEREKPLALYLFTNQQDIQQKVLSTCSFGGGCINDTIIHLASHHLGFGGVGNSGIGTYHGHKSFLTFSHTKSIIRKATWIDLPMRYYPYTSWKDKFIRFFMK